MNKKELKKLLKPLVKECIQEALIEEGLLSNVVSEVVKGLGTQTIVEASSVAPPKVQAPLVPEPQNVNLKQHRKKLLEAISRDSFNGVDLFEGTAPLTRHESSNAPPGATDLGDPRDPGVDISGILGNSAHIFGAMK
jgi:hypothetical protein